MIEDEPVRQESISVGRVDILAIPSVRKQIWVLAWPVLLNSLLFNMVEIIDTVMVGRLGPQAVAAVGLGGHVFSVVMVLLFAIAAGTIALVARSVGSNDKETAQQVLKQSMILAIIFSVVTMVPGIYFARDILALFRLEPEVTELGTPYVQIIMAAVIFLSVGIIFASGLQGAGDTRTPLYISIVINILNVGANYVLIFGKLGFPRLGVTGAAIGTAGSLGMGIVIFVFLFMSKRLILSMPVLPLKVDWDLIRRILRVGFPVALSQLLLQVGFLIYLRIMAIFGAKPVAAYVIGVRILTLAFIPGMGFAAAASTLVGQNLGAGFPEKAKESAREACRLAILFMSLLGTVFFLAARPIGYLIIQDIEVVALTAIFIRILAVAQPMMAIDFTLGGALRGAGDTKWPLYAISVGFYLFRLPLAYFFAGVINLPILWAWMTLLVDYAVRNIIIISRFRSEKWKEIKV
ncbi:MAG: MATE family efflux transporter [Deltaproteobacteria bacterium]|nr:MAG: MATE family efflux transporter [Deltaproteobacteria bacterium]